MRAKFLLLFGAMTLLAGVASATTVDCAAGGLTNLQLLINQTNGGSGCQIGDVLITGVTYNQGTSGVAASAVTTGFVDLPGANVTGAERGITFTGGWAALDNITITFSGTLCYNTSGSPGCLSTTPDFLAGASTQLHEGQVEEQVPGGSPNGTSTNSITPTGQGALNLSAGPGNNLNTEVLYQGTTGFTMSLHDNGTGAINSLEGDVEEVVGPEPGSMFLMGGALLGLTVASKKLRKNK